jgi:glutamine synthetase
MDALGPMLAQSYLAVKRSEHRSFAAQEIDFEINRHFYTF